jgi:ribosomal protein L19
MMTYINKKLNEKKYFFKKGDFIQIEKKTSRNSNKTKKIFGRCINYKKNGINSTVTILHVVKKYKIIETIPVYSQFITNITLYKKLK